MATNILSLVILVAASSGLVWLAWRAWHARNIFARVAAGLLSSLLALILVAVSVVAAIGLVKIYAPRGGPIQDIHAQGSPQQIARGEHITQAFCASCHSTTGGMPLTGGVDMAKDLPFPLGSFVSVNLTPAGPLKNMSDGEILRVLREGADPNGRWLPIMSNVSVKHMSDEDLMAVIAFLRSQEPVENVTQQPPDKINLLGAIMIGVGLLPMEPPVVGPITAPPMAATAEYGAYILSYQDCRTCHGPDLTGGTNPLLPRGPSLRVVKGWTQDQFITTLRTGVNPGGHMLSDVMPWKQIGKMDDVELSALYLHLVSLQ